MTPRCPVSARFDAGGGYGDIAQMNATISDGQGAHARQHIRGNRRHDGIRRLRGNDKKRVRDRTRDERNRVVSRCESQIAVILKCDRRSPLSDDQRLAVERHGIKRQPRQRTPGDVDRRAEAVERIWTTPPPRCAVDNPESRPCRTAWRIASAIKPPSLSAESPTWNRIGVRPDTTVIVGSESNSNVTVPAPPSKTTNDCPSTTPAAAAPTTGTCSPERRGDLEGYSAVKFQSPGMVGNVDDLQGLPFDETSTARGYFEHLSVVKAILKLLDDPVRAAAEIDLEIADCISDKTNLVAGQRRTYAETGAIDRLDNRICNFRLGIVDVKRNTNGDRVVLNRRNVAVELKFAADIGSVGDFEVLAVDERDPTANDGHDRAEIGIVGQIRRRIEGTSHATHLERRIGHRSIADFGRCTCHR